MYQDWKQSNKQSKKKACILWKKIDCIYKDHDFFANIIDKKKKTKWKIPDFYELTLKEMDTDEIKLASVAWK